MFKVSSLFSNACPKTWTPLLDGPFDDLLIKHLPLFNQTRHEVIDSRMRVRYTRCSSMLQM